MGCGLKNSCFLWGKLLLLEFNSLGSKLHAKVLPRIFRELIGGELRKTVPKGARGCLFLI